MPLSFAGTTVSVSANWEIALYVIIASIYGISQYIILNFIKRITTQIRRTIPVIKTLNQFTYFYQYIALAFVVTIIGQIFLLSYYNTAILNLGSIEADLGVFVNLYNPYTFSPGSFGIGDSITDQKRSYSTIY